MFCIFFNFIRKRSKHTMSKKPVCNTPACPPARSPARPLPRPANRPASRPASRPANRPASRPASRPAPPCPDAPPLPVPLPPPPPAVDVPSLAPHLGCSRMGPMGWQRRVHEARGDPQKTVRFGCLWVHATQKDHAIRIWGSGPELSAENCPKWPQISKSLDPKTPLWGPPTPHLAATNQYGGDRTRSGNFKPPRAAWSARRLAGRALALRSASGLRSRLRGLSVG